MSSEETGTESPAQKRQGGNALFEAYETSAEAESEGLWYVPPALVGRKNAPRFLIARYGGENNPLFDKAMESITRSERKAIEDRSLSKGKQREIGIETFTKASLLDWESVDMDGKPLPFSIPNAKILFNRLPDLFLELLDASSDRGLYLREGLEVDAKNL